MLCSTLAVALCGGTLYGQGAPATRIVGEEVAYRDGQTALSGWAAYDAATSARRPVVLIFHDWDGIDKHEKDVASKLAELGYLGFAVDVFGKGVRPKTADAAGAEVGRWYRDPKAFRRRILAGMEAAIKHKLADATRVAAIGYCFGGKAALELARSGAPIRGAVSFHGSLTSSQPGDAKNIRCKLLVLHGADDPAVPPEEVRAFEREMRAAGVKYKLVRYPGAVHAFTIRDASKWGLAAAKYNAEADRRSWEEMKRFLADTLKKR
jgi:dienelactone hydrolase